MRKFKKGDTVVYVNNGVSGLDESIGTILHADRFGFYGVRFEDYNDYHDDLDDDSEDGLDFHHCREESLRLYEPMMKYDPTQQGDTEDDI